ncbi:MAG: tetratricopeptide repeat protein [Candidatus Hydrogenedentota bacterium]
MAHMYTFSIRALFCAGLAAVLIATGLGCGGRRSEQLQERGDTYLHIGRYSEAVNEYERAIAADPENAAAYLGKGRALTAQDETGEALEAFEEAIERRSDYEEAYTEAVHLLVEEDQEDEALEMAHSFATADPLKGGILLAHTQHRVGATTDAIDTLEQLRDQYPAEGHAHVNLALLYLAEGEYNEAETTLRRVLDTIDETSLPARMGLIDVHRAQGNLDEVIEGLRDLVAEEQQSDPEAAEQPGEDQYLTTLKLALARSLLETGEFEEAEEIAQPILEAIPESGWANYIIGACMLQRDEYTEALQYLQIAARALPEQPAVDRRLARAENRRAEEPDDEEEETLAAGEPGGPAKHGTPCGGKPGCVNCSRTARPSSPGKIRRRVIPWRSRP